MDTYKKNRRNSRIAWTIAFVFAIFYLLVCLIPFVFMIINSFKGQFEMFTKGIFEMPSSFYLGNYSEVIHGNFVRYFRNSVIVLLIAITILLFISACAAYPIARFDLKYTKTVYALIIAAMSIPIHITLIPVFKMTMKLHLYDTLYALIGPYVAFGIPISVFLLTAFMVSIPKEIEEAALLDGCGKVRLFFQVILPLSKPGLSTLVIYHGVHMWNEFSFAYTLTQSVQNRTLPLAVWDFKGQYSMNIPMILAVLTLTALPMIILFIFFQDKLIKGMTAGAVKS